MGRDSSAAIAARLVENAVDDDPYRFVDLDDKDAFPKLNSFTAADLQHMQFDPLRYVIPGYLAEGATLLAGKPKLGKSWMAYDWSVSVAMGGYAFGSVKCEEGDVLYGALEDNPRRLQRRMNQLFPAGQSWPARLTLCTRMKRVSDGLLDEIRGWAHGCANPRLVIIDTLARVRPPSKRNDNPYEADYRAVAPFLELAAELKIAIVIVHHTRKAEADDPLDMVSGTTGLTGGVDSVMVLSRDGQGTTLHGRGRDLDDIESAVKLDTSGQWTLLGDADEVRRSKERNRILEALRELGTAGPKEIAEATGMKISNVKFLVHKMAAAAELEKLERGHYRLPL